MSLATVFPNPRADGDADNNADSNAELRVGDYERAAAEIRSWPYYAPTPLLSLAGLARELGLAAILYKDEAQRFGLGSFKALGGAYAVLRLIQRHVSRATGSTPASDDLRLGANAALAESITVTTATDGNHGRAVAWGASQFGCRAVIYVPRACSAAREHAIASFGACVVRTTSDYDDTMRQCAADAARNGWQVVADTSWEGYEEIPATVMEGYLVMAGEAAEQVGQIPTHVFVQAGVGGLAAAVCSHFRERWGGAAPRFAVVEPEGAAALFASAGAGRPQRAPGEVHTIMAGLECGEVSPIAWRVLDRGADFFVTVPDSVVPGCLRLLAHSPHGDASVFAGESAVAGLAALLEVARDPAARALLHLDHESRVLLFGTEGVTDAVVWRALVTPRP